MKSPTQKQHTIPESIWNLVLGAVIGALCGATVTYISDIRKQRHEREMFQMQVAKERDQARMQALRGYLEDKVKTRREAYRKVHVAVREALLHPSPSNRASATKSLADDIPFFQPRYKTQMAIRATTRELIAILLNDPRFATGIKDPLLQPPNLLDALDRDFEADLSAIEGELLALRQRAEGQ